MFDCHCHLLPGIDDGSRSVDMSLEMLTGSMAQGVRSVIFTPHFYADMDSPETFLRRRAESLKRLEDGIRAKSLEDKIPEYILGAEVHYFRGMSRSQALEDLTIGGSSYILIEMPFRNWQPQMVDEIMEISRVLGLSVIIAHIERYLDQDRKLVKRLIEDPDILIQSNAEFFIEHRTTRKALKMLTKGQIDLLGSDSHNMTGRAPNLGEAVEIIKAGKAESQLGRIYANGVRIFSSATSEVGDY